MAAFSYFKLHLMKVFDSFNSAFNKAKPPKTNPVRLLFDRFHSAPDFIINVVADLPTEQSVTVLSAAFHALLPVRLIKGMKSPVQQLASTVTFASCQIRKT